MSTATLPSATLPSDALAQRLADSGLRSTPQREVIYDVLLKKRDHPTADEVFARVKSELPTVSLATVYNCLETLVSCQLVRAVNFERGPTRYCPNLSPHAHFHDEQSGQTHDIELPPALLKKVHAVLPRGYDATSVEIIFRGKATRSSEQRAASSQPTRS
ncbi:MAG: transcriptional repressor [Opitutus sp.]|nr:transcriptional repressor [Opitutus sp.]